MGLKRQSRRLDIIAVDTVFLLMFVEQSMLAGLAVPWCPTPLWHAVSVTIPLTLCGTRYKPDPTWTNVVFDEQLARHLTMHYYYFPLDDRRRGSNVGVSFCHVSQRP